MISIIDQFENNFNFNTCAIHEEIQLFIKEGQIQKYVKVLLFIINICNNVKLAEFVLMVTHNFAKKTSKVVNLKAALLFCLIQQKMGCCYSTQFSI